MSRLSLEQPFQFQSIGVDISDESFKFLALKRRGKWEILFSGESDIPPGVIAEGEIKNGAVLSGSLKDRLRPYKSHTPYISLALPEEKGFLRLINIQKLPKEDIHKALEFQLEEHIPIPPQELVFDFEIVSIPQSAKEEMTLLVTAYPKGVVESYIKVVRDAGFMPVVFELESQAVARAVVPEWDMGAVIVGDIGKTRTTFSIVYKKAVYFTSTIKMGGRDINALLMRQLEITQEEAQEIKMGRGFDYSSGDIIKALSPAVVALKDEAARQISFWEHHAQHGEPLVSRVYLCGGDAHLRGLPEFFSRELELPVERSRIFENVFDLNHYIPPLTAHDTLLYATALGLALRSEESFFNVL